MKKIKIPTKKRMREYEKMLEKAGKEFVLTPEDLTNLTDLHYMFEDDAYETLKLNKMYKWFQEFSERIERITIPEVYEKPKKRGKK